MKIVMPNLETLKWTINNSKDVNPVLADMYTVTPFTGGMTSSVSGPAYAGALGRPEQDLPVINNATKFTLQYQMWLPKAMQLVQALEFDLMVSGPGGEVYNCSCQCNVAGSNMWQIAKAGGDWIDTGFRTALPTTTWIPVETKFVIDRTKKLISCLSIAVAGQVYQIPTSLQNVPAQNLAWGPNVAVPQRQLDLSSLGGQYSVDDANINLIQE